ncbi:MAG TPA: hypothetical protein VJ302_27020, partial [Blastocatellia bacterium]|nr:hypothetical protein [Blastocatellia bacterium]
MKLPITFLLMTLVCSLSLAQEKTPLTSLETLNRLAKQKVEAQANVPLAAETSEICAGADALETGKIPNYARALALLPNAAKPLALAFRAYLYEGTIEPETKMAMGLRIAQIYGSAYPATHL